MHRFYDPLVALAVISVLRFALAVARPQWAWYPPVSELGQAALTLIMLHFLLNASGQMTNGEWHPFVVLADSARNSTQYIKVAAIVNVSILLSLAGTWIGLCIAVPINIWQLLRSFRERRLRPNTASLQLQ